MRRTPSSVLEVDSFRNDGLAVFRTIVPEDSTDVSGEALGDPHKTIAVMLKCCDKYIANGVSKHSFVTSLGGGVVNSLCGVIVSLIYRGLSLVHITTTAVGMLDAAIDFKL